MRSRALSPRSPPQTDSFVFFAPFPWIGIGSIKGNVNTIRSRNGCLIPPTRHAVSAPLLWRPPRPEASCSWVSVTILPSVIFQEHLFRGTLFRFGTKVHVDCGMNRMIVVGEVAVTSQSSFLAISQEFLR